MLTTFSTLQDGLHQILDMMDDYSLQPSPFNAVRRFWVSTRLAAKPFLTSPGVTSFAGTESRKLDRRNTLDRSPSVLGRSAGKRARALEGSGGHRGLGQANRLAVKVSLGLPSHRTYTALDTDWKLSLTALVWSTLSRMQIDSGRKGLSRQSLTSLPQEQRRRVFSRVPFECGTQ